ncbi:Ribose-phosphate pyrophosphokinase [Galdieria sulphuraria]|uniref:ribose-phosphate diphosphokinase n=1 Tax=Galdieria sulphuraria TaxID=130081 RepID=M2Y6J4_GALSU|nr:ribose-phosphate pyrophosphokinase [Galdieria sulphuraria]EME31469.1 ribose-phosphate pyrophosphokinase [Galdieria sulphuraria]GJD06622.1 Ribose-phosphate pyrophosphokinase [Galdieria sulphuraria]|eukprot:XP_005707989.1 ribose-phosphate pyrophosphokinase [Galdieria sulphuraria]
MQNLSSSFPSSTSWFRLRRAYRRVWPLSCVENDKHHSDVRKETLSPLTSTYSPVTVPESIETSALSDLSTEEKHYGGLSFGSHKIRIYSGSSNTELASEVAKYLGKPELSPIMRKRFSDGEIYVRLEESVRGCSVFLLQSTCYPANDHLIELLLMIDACRRAHASQVTAVLPYYGYARADRLVDPDTKRREALASKLVANMICEAGADRVIVMDIHSPQTCGFFDIPLDHIFASPCLVEYLLKNCPSDMVVVAPDVGGVARARAFAKQLNDAPLAIIDKRREQHNIAKVLNLIGDVRGRTAVLVDDMIDTGGTIAEAAKSLRENGAKRVFAVATHAVFSGAAIERLSSGVFEEVIVTNTIQVPKEKRFPQLRIVNVASLLGETIWRVHEDSLY